VAVACITEIERAVDTLERTRQRCPIAPESVHLEREIRQLLVDPYRILFTIVEREVHVLHVRHAPSNAGTCLSHSAVSCLRLVERLIASLEPDPEVEAVWSAEVTRRVHDWEAGRVAEVSWDEARRQIEGRLRSR
jgi:putative addiction module component (TIGR02574 family)